jgi:hypothetical protein
MQPAWRAGRAHLPEALRAPLAPLRVPAVFVAVVCGWYLFRVPTLPGAPELAALASPGAPADLADAQADPVEGAITAVTDLVRGHIRAQPRRSSFVIFARPGGQRFSRCGRAICSARLDPSPTATRAGTTATLPPSPRVLSEPALEPPPPTERCAGVGAGGDSQCGKSFVGSTSSALF